MKSLIINKPTIKPTKKACNYYLKVDTIKELKQKAISYNMKDSQLLEFILKEAFKQL